MKRKQEAPTGAQVVDDLKEECRRAYALRLWAGKGEWEGRSDADERLAEYRSHVEELRPRLAANPEAGGVWRRDLDEG